MLGVPPPRIEALENHPGRDARTQPADGNRRVATDSRRPPPDEHRHAARCGSTRTRESRAGVRRSATASFPRRALRSTPCSRPFASAATRDRSKRSTTTCNAPCTASDATGRRCTRCRASTSPCGTLRGKVAQRPLYRLLGGAPTRRSPRVREPTPLQRCGRRAGPPTRSKRCAAAIVTSNSTRSRWTRSRPRERSRAPVCGSCSTPTAPGQSRRRSRWRAASFRSTCTGSRSRCGRPTISPGLARGSSQGWDPDRRGRELWQRVGVPPRVRGPARSRSRSPA